MKKLAIILFISLFPLGSAETIAQPTLTASTNTPVAGDVFNEHICATSAECDTTGVGAATAISGVNVTWNLSAITTDELITRTFISSAGTPYIGSFPKSNLAYFVGTLSENIYEYNIVNANEWASSGEYDGGIYYFPKPYVYLHYPFTYNSTSVDTSILYSLPITDYYTTIDKNVCDAYGTLILPTGTYTNVLRIHTTEYQIDSLSDSSSSYNTIDTNEIYYWFQPYFHFLMSVIEYRISSGVIYFNEVAYYTQSASGITTVNNNDINMEISPNPATDMITIKFNLPTGQAGLPENADNTTLTLSDVSGRIVGAVSNAGIKNGSNEIKYPVSNLPAGIYFVHLKNNETNITKKVVIVK